MTLDRLQAHYGFTPPPFGRTLAPGVLLEELRLLTLCRDGLPLAVRLSPGRPADPAATDQARHLRRPGPTPRVALRDARMSDTETKSYLTHHLALAPTRRSPTTRPC
jgi:hypothetical protein